jgi:hypothetical protein
MRDPERTGLEAAPFLAPGGRGYVLMPAERGCLSTRCDAPGKGNRARDAQKPPRAATNAG